MLKTSTVALAAALLVGTVVPVTFLAARADGRSIDTACFDVYDAQGSRRTGTIVPAGIARSQCTTPTTCSWGFDARGRRTSMIVPYRWAPAKCQLVAATTTTRPPATTSTTSTTSTTLPASATSTTTAATTSTTAATTTSSVAATTTTAATTTSTTTSTTTRPPAPPSDPTTSFVADFTGNTGLDAFDTGVYHRDDYLVDTRTWTGDHDLDCGDPSTQRNIVREQPTQSFYLCRDHLMTSVGDTSGYSIAWFAPKQTFRRGVDTSVSWDVNVTDLGNRQWWEVSIVPVGSPFLATVGWVASTAGIDAYDNRSIVVGKGPFGNDGNIVTQGVQRDPLGWGHVCGSGAADPEGCASKAIRRTFTITDNQNGTVTVDFLGESYTYPGAFPDEFKVYFKDHNYTPDKDGTPVGHTWHWDNVVVH